MLFPRWGHELRISGSLLPEVVGGPVWDRGSATCATVPGAEALGGTARAVSGGF